MILWAQSIPLKRAVFSRKKIPAMGIVCISIAGNELRLDGRQ
nr:hypothetical protein [uncultured Desulfobulbus sp.]